MIFYSWEIRFQYKPADNNTMTCEFIKSQLRSFKLQAYFKLKLYIYNS